MGKRDRGDIITSGFDSRAPWINRALGVLSECERHSQKLLGTSLMAILQQEEFRDERDCG